MNEERLKGLEKYYAVHKYPLCCVCGKKLNIVSMGPGGVTYACVGRNKNGKYYKGRSFVDGHYSKSRVHHYQTGDPDVLVLIKEYRKLKGE